MEIHIVQNVVDQIEELDPVRTHEVGSALGRSSVKDMLCSKGWIAPVRPGMPEPDGCSSEVNGSSLILGPF